MHHVGRLSEAAAAGGLYAANSTGHARLSLIEPATGSVHQELAVAALEASGQVARHMHAFEQGLHVLEGQLLLNVAGVEEKLDADDYVFIESGVPHSVSNPSSRSARWLELSAPQPVVDLDDTVFVDEDAQEAKPELPHRRGHFDESQLPPPSDSIGLAGFGTANVGGASLRMLIDREFGASQFNLFVVEYVPGGLIKEHDHPFEEAFFFVSGEIEAVLDGKTYTLQAGDYCWSGVGSMHTFENRSDRPVRWIETQVPQPPSRHQARFRNEWERLTGRGA